MNVERRERLATKLKISPSLEEVRALAEPNSLIPVSCEIPADVDTPVSAYLKLSDGAKNPSFLLESVVEGGERMGRYTYLGTPTSVIEVPAGAPEDPLKLIESHLTRKLITVPGLPPFKGGFVGYVGYDCVRQYEPKVPPHRRDTLLSSVPDSLFFQADPIVAFDHLHPLHSVIKVISHIPVDDPSKVDKGYREAEECIDSIVNQLQQPIPSAQELAPKEGIIGESWANMTKEEYEEMVRQALKSIRDGENIQTVLSLRLSRRTPAHPFAVYRKLRMINPSPYMFYIEFGNGLQLVGSSPELLLKVEGGKITMWPLAGTRPRGKTKEEDLALGEDLRTDEKERAEHIMLVDLGRNDVGRVAKIGSVRVEELMATERFPSVMHLRSKITGELAPQYSPLDALRSCFPVGTVSGAPKVRAMEIIAELEKDRRGPYAGAVGYIGYDNKGDHEMAIAIRTIVFKDGVANVQAGAGIVADSIPESEYHECLRKAQRQMKAIEDAEK